MSGADDLKRLRTAPFAEEFLNYVSASVPVCDNDKDETDLNHLSGDLIKRSTVLGTQLQTLLAEAQDLHHAEAKDTKSQVKANQKVKVKQQKPIQHVSDDENDEEGDAELLQQMQEELLTCRGNTEPVEITWMQRIVDKVSDHDQAETNALLEPHMCRNYTDHRYRTRHAHEPSSLVDGQLSRASLLEEAKSQSVNAFGMLRLIKAFSFVVDVDEPATHREYAANDEVQHQSPLRQDPREEFNNSNYMGDDHIPSTHQSLEPTLNDDDEAIDQEERQVRINAVSHRHRNKKQKQSAKPACKKAQIKFPSLQAMKDHYKELANKPSTRKSNVAVFHASVEKNLIPLMPSSKSNTTTSSTGGQPFTRNIPKDPTSITDVHLKSFGLGLQLYSTIKQLNPNDQRLTTTHQNHFTLMRNIHRTNVLVDAQGHFDIQSELDMNQHMSPMSQPEDFSVSFQPVLADSTDCYPQEEHTIMGTTERLRKSSSLQVTAIRTLQAVDFVYDEVRVPSIPEMQTALKEVMNPPPLSSLITFVNIAKRIIDKKDELDESLQKESARRVLVALIFLADSYNRSSESSYQMILSTPNETAADYDVEISFIASEHLEG